MLLKDHARPRFLSSPIALCLVLSSLSQAQQTRPPAPEQEAEEVDSQPVVWHQRLRLKPGLYQVRVALRGTTPLINSQPCKVLAAADPARLPFWSELSLEQLTPGRYGLRLTATDLTTNRTAIERVGFYVE